VQRKAYLFEDKPDDPLGLDPTISEIPANLAADAKKYRDALIEAVADSDDVIAEKYLSGHAIDANELMVGIRKATVALKFTGVIPGSAFKKKGVQRLLDCVVNYLPNPLDITQVKGQDSEGQEVSVKADDRLKTAALAFKLWSDPYVGRLVFARIYQGQLKRGQSLYNPRTRRTERVSRLLLMRAMDKEEIDIAYAGDICAVVGVKDVITGDTLCDEDLDIRLEPPSFPEPVISMSIEPKSKADQEKMGTALQRLSAEDPTFRTFTDTETGQTIIAGMGELHLEIIRDRMFREFKVEADAGKPQIAYRESITGKAEAEGKFIRQSGGRGQYGHVWIEVEPNEKGKGFEFENAIVGGVVPKEYIKPVEQGIVEAMKNGVLAGYPVEDVKVKLYDGSFHDVDSSEMAFKIAGSMAFKEAARKASPAILEPIMAVEVVTPEEYMGDVIGDLNSRRGKIEGMNPRKDAQVIKAAVPLSEMFGYSTTLRSMTQGRAIYTMELSHYDETPKSVSDQIIEKLKGKETVTA
jgi:elongation factor G